MQLVTFKCLFGRFNPPCVETIQTRIQHKLMGRESSSQAHRTCRWHPFASPGVSFSQGQLPWVPGKRLVRLSTTLVPQHPRVIVPAPNTHFSASSRPRPGSKEAQATRSGTPRNVPPRRSTLAQQSKTDQVQALLLPSSISLISAPLITNTLPPTT